MHMPSITADYLAVLALACAALALWMTWLWRGSHGTFNGGILLSAGFMTGCALPLLPWAELATEASDQVVAGLHLLEVAYVILTL
ncbi:hypothetical protein [Bradyrhizobium diazoefficiens]|jgi:hypothetical protein|uniref:Bsr5791 protein n=1 Tax=Bradyrhizobium diazoefficiens (strain JCM 10833 / BCRC 13528 / IAM 13628 / NBRC 14792 / USDA 110) TaxID=224911 RepID=Q89I48_BRADU|nr:hypothetical protein [Bradyrhizobium diazoefficiens]AND90950.1 hypothetical protein AAV28_26495 [Bradyrhizobium diazoefficiens USDA 110]PDT58298.1 hypothetical protein CO678_29295 [Bradyrhizobium diazoefficiens]QBP24564.1 hypothetical protein Bdiaspc4_30585 [Bradyrhizobium diazoefficiens]QLD42466.1 hypothetical protein HUW42_16325 [Bradyrhizobium diazoefficiens]WLB35966.1 hypothetical protein QIH78_31470 [Bradyrhizobium diazoefficiens]